MKSDPLLSPVEVAEYLGLSVETLAQWRSKKRGLPYLKLGSRVAYRPEDISKWLATKTVAVGSR